MKTFKFPTAFLLGTLILAGCDYGPITSGPPRVLECPGRPSNAVSTPLGAEGGVVSGAWYRLTLPPNAVEQRTVFWMRPEQSDRMQIQVVAEEQEDFTFRIPATLALSYEFCTRVPEELRIYEVDENGAVVEDLGGEIDRAAGEVRVQVDHLSIYILAEPS